MSTGLDQLFKWLARSGKTNKLGWYVASKTRIKRNIQTYLAQLLVTTMALLVFLIEGVPLIFVDINESILLYADEIQWVIYFGILVMTLYLWELSYKSKMNWALVVHHLTTIICIGVAGTHLAITGAWFSIQAFVTLGLTALTEQSTFVALILYRMELWRHAGRAFMVSAIWTIVTKTFLVVITMVLWWYSVVYPFLYVPGNKDLIMWVYLAWFLILPLFGSQIYSAVILFHLAKVSFKKFDLEEQNRQNRPYPSLKSKKRSVREQLEQLVEADISEERPFPPTALFASQSIIELSSVDPIPIQVSKEQ